MNIPPKCEDLYLKVAELERREAALREELDAIKASVDGYDSPEHAAQVADELGHQCNVLQQRLTVAEQRVGEMNSALARIHGRAEMFIDDGMHMPTPSIEAIRDIAAKAALKPAEEDDSDLQKIGFVRMNTKTDQPRISMADMHARYERKPCQEPQAHPTRCGCEDLSHDQ